MRTSIKSSTILLHLLVMGIPALLPSRAEAASRRCGVGRRVYSRKGVVLMRRSRLWLLAAGVVLFTAASAGAKEAYVNLDQAVGDAEFIVVGTVREATAEQGVRLAVDTWLRGTATKSGELTVQGETGFCVMRGPVSRFMTVGKRYLVFVLPGGRVGRLGHIQQIGPDGAIAPQYIDLDGAAPATEQAFTQLIRDRQEKVPAELLKQLDSPDPAVRATAARRLGALRVRSAAAPLLKIAQDPASGTIITGGEGSLQVVAITALGRLRVTEMVPPLLGMLEKGAPSLRYTLAAALGELGDPRAAPAIIGTARSTLANRDEINREEKLAVYVRALVAIGDFSPEVERLLADVLRTAGPAAGEIVNAGAQLERAGLVGVFAGALSDPNAETVRLASMGLLHISGLSRHPQPAGELSQEEARRLAAEVLKERRIDVSGRTANVRKAQDFGWLLTWPAGKGQGGGGTVYVFVASGSRQAAVLPAQGRTP